MNSKSVVQLKKDVGFWRKNLDFGAGDPESE